MDLALLKKDFKLINVSKGAQELMDKYRAAVTVSDDTRKEFLGMGQIQTASTNLGMDDEIKRNALLRYALEDPKSYIEKRTAMLEIIKVKVDKEFQKVFLEYSTGINQLPVIEAKDLAGRAAKDVYTREMDRLESLYPQEFGVTVYNKAIQRQIAKKMIGKKEVNLDEDEFRE